MGTLYKAHCICGFETDTRVGGSRASHMEYSYFPHYCADCGLVDCNIAKNRSDADKPIHCPKCDSESVISYGTNILNEDKTVKHQFPEISWYKDHNFCPNCCKFTLSFKPIMFYG